MMNEIKWVFISPDETYNHIYFLKRLFFLLFFCFWFYTSDLPERSLK